MLLSLPAELLTSHLYSLLALNLTFMIVNSSSLIITSGPNSSVNSLSSSGAVLQVYVFCGPHWQLQCSDTVVFTPSCPVDTMVIVPFVGGTEGRKLLCKPSQLARNLEPTKNSVPWVYCVYTYLMLACCLWSVLPWSLALWRPKTAWQDVLRLISLTVVECVNHGYHGYILTLLYCGISFNATIHMVL